MMFHEQYGIVTRTQLAAYRKHNVSPSDHDQLVSRFGEDSKAIVGYIKQNVADHGFFQIYFL